MGSWPDALGRRFKNVKKNAQGQVTADQRFVYDGLDLIADLNSSNQVVASYTSGLGIDDPLVMRWNGNNYFYHKNHLGSVTSLTNSSGSVVQTYQYEAFGKIRSASGSVTQNTLTYTARERHVASGLYYYRARWYDPQLGRFVSQDPIGILGGVNLYTYAANGPVNFTDPLGLTEIYIYVKRTDSLKDRTVGKLAMYAKPIGYIALGYTLEPPYKDNRSFDSCIPSGYYPAELYKSPEFGRQVLRLQDVPGRADIEFHPGNFPGDTAGCILPGKERRDDLVWRSKDALDEMLGHINAITNADRRRHEKTSIGVYVFYGD